MGKLKIRIVNDKTSIIRKQAETSIQEYTDIDGGMLNETPTAAPDQHSAIDVNKVPGHSYASPFASTDAAQPEHEKIITTRNMPRHPAVMKLLDGKREISSKSVDEMAETEERKREMQEKFDANVRRRNAIDQVKHDDRTVLDKMESLGMHKQMHMSGDHDMTIIRVPGGFIYLKESGIYGDRNMCSTFVPWSQGTYY